MTLGNRVAAQDAIRGAVHHALDGLADVAVRLDMRGVRDELGGIDEALRSDRFTVTVVGRFSSGKSTFLNALLTDLTHPVDLGGAPGPLPAGDLPCSAVLTDMVYSETPYARAWHRDGSSTAWSLERYLRESAIDNEKDDAENGERFANITRFELGYPARLLQTVELRDSPGKDDTPGRTEITDAACAESDAVILMFSSHALMGAQELEDAADAMAGKLGVFTVVNLFAPARAENPMRARVWNAYVRPRLRDPDRHPWARQDLEGGYRIHFVDALSALRAREAGDDAGVAEHGLAGFEQQMSEFLTTERVAAHVTSHASRALGVVGRIEQALKERQAVHRGAQAEFEAWARKMAVAVRETEQRGTELGRIVARHRDAVRREVDASLAQRERDIQYELEEHLLTAEIPILDTLTAAVRPRKVADAVAAAASRYIVEQRTAWMNGQAEQILDADRDALITELERELAVALQPVEEAHVQMPGMEDMDGRIELVSRGQQWAAGALAVLTGNGAAALGAAGGFRAVAGGVGGMLAAGVVLGALGVTAAPVVIPVALIANALGGLGFARVGLRKRVVGAAIPTFQKVLRDGEAQRRADVGAQLDARYDDIRIQVEKDFQAIVDQEREELEELMRARRHEGTQRERWLADLAAAERQVAAHREALESARAAAAQQAATGRVQAGKADPAA